MIGQRNAQKDGKVRIRAGPNSTPPDEGEFEEACILHIVMWRLQAALAFTLPLAARNLLRELLEEIEERLLPEWKRQAAGEEWKIAA